MANSVETKVNVASKVARNVAERVDRLEKILERLMGSLGRSLNEQQKQLAQMDELLGAVIQVIGVDTITEAVVEARKKKLQAAADELRADVDQKVKAGTLVPAETIGGNSYLICSVFDANGNKIEEALTGVAVAQLLKQFKDAALGQKVGHRLNTPDGRILEVTEVYEQVTPSVAEVANELAENASEPVGQAEAP